MIPSCRGVAQLLYEEPQLANKTLQIQEQGVVIWHPHTGWGETQKSGQVWCGRGPGWHPHIAPGPNPLPREGTAKGWHDVPGPFTSVPESSPQLPLKGPQCHPTHTGGARPYPSHLLVNPSPDPHQNQRKQILSTTPVGGFMQKWKWLYTSISGRS